MISVLDKKDVVGLLVLILIAIVALNPWDLHIVPAISHPQRIFEGNLKNENCCHLVLSCHLVNAD